MQKMSYSFSFKNCYTVNLSIKKFYYWLCKPLTVEGVMRMLIKKILSMTAIIALLVVSSQAYAVADTCNLKVDMPALKELSVDSGGTLSFDLSGTKPGDVIAAQDIGISFHYNETTGTLFEIIASLDSALPDGLNLKVNVDGSGEFNNISLGGTKYDADVVTDISPSSDTETVSVKIIWEDDPGGYALTPQAYGPYVMTLTLGLQI